MCTSTTYIRFIIIEIFSNKRTTPFRENPSILQQNKIPASKSSWGYNGPCVSSHVSKVIASGSRASKEHVSYWNLKLAHDTYTHGHTWRYIQVACIHTRPPIHIHVRTCREPTAHTCTHTRVGTTKVAIARDTRAETKWPRRKRYVSPTVGHITGSTPVTQNRTNFSAR